MMAPTLPYFLHQAFFGYLTLFTMYVPLNVATVKGRPTLSTGQFLETELLKGSNVMLKLRGIRVLGTTMQIFILFIFNRFLGRWKS